MKSGGKQPHAPESPPTHPHKGGTPLRVGCLVITCSDTRTPATDTSGALIKNALLAHGHRVVATHLVPDDPAQIRKLLKQGAKHPEVQALIITGGTGISRRDSTFEAIDGLLEKRLDGFGEIFRYLSYQQIGSAAIMSRATAGVYRDTVVISIPGSEKAVRLAMDQLILKELGHMVRELTKEERP